MLSCFQAVTVSWLFIFRIYCFQAVTVSWLPSMLLRGTEALQNRQGHNVVILEIKHTHIYLVWQLTYSTELLVYINQSNKQYKQEGEENSSQLNSTHSSSLYFSVLCSLHSLLAHKPQLFNVSNYRLSWEQEIMATMNFHFMLSGRWAVPASI